MKKEFFGKDFSARTAGRAIILFLILASALGIAGAQIPDQGDEFVGPFPSWTNVKIVYGAKGDGVADDTAAFQLAFDEIGTSSHSPVLYIPAGSYRITSTLNIITKINVSLVGEDPETTTLFWDGAEAGTLLSINDTAYS